MSHAQEFDGAQCWWAGKLSSRIQSFAVGGLGRGEASTEVVAGVINSPSADCNRLLQVADLHAAASQADSMREYLARVPKHFLVVTVEMKVRHVAGKCCLCRLHLDMLITKVLELHIPVQAS